MKSTLAIILLLIMQYSLAQNQPLFKISLDNKVGYINDKGTIVIKPVFLSGNDFSEGLAAVRLNGTYGFINEKGDFVIKPEYDFATNFVNGISVVYKNGAPLFIDKTGNNILPKVFTGFTFLNTRKGIITTITRKQGIMDIVSKQLLVDTIFSAIDGITNGVAIVHEYTPPKQQRKKDRVAVIDSTGKLVVPFGKYETIKPFYNGYSTVELESDENKDDGITDGVIDTKGHLLFKRPYKNNSYIAGDFHDGFARVSLYKYWLPERNGTSFTTEKSYEGFINLKGKVIFNDTDYRYVKDFSNNRAFIKKDNSDYILIDHNFKRVGDKEFQSIPSETFKGGYAIVETSDGTGIIDTAGNYVIQPVYENIERLGILNDYFFYSSQTRNNETLYGIADLNGNVIVKPVMQEFDHNGFTNGLIKTVINNKFSYINTRGNIIWQQQDDTSQALKLLNIDFMNRGYFYAYSSPTNTGDDLSGGWAASNNKPHTIINTKFPTHSFSITVDTTIKDTFAVQYFGYKLFISNTTTDTVQFNAQDSRLYLKLQAQNTNGEWKDIEYLPSSWCGNSYHKIALEPNAFWSFTIPKYTGAVQTKIRAQLRYIDIKNPRAEKIIYSNSINGSINPGQFWNKRTYYPADLMDPYND